jgi:Ca2+:H+ antiporter
VSWPFGHLYSAHHTTVGPTTNIKPVALVTPAAFSSFVPSSTEGAADPVLEASVTSISRATAVILLIAYCVYVYFQMSTHHNIMAEALEEDEERDRDRHRDLSKKKLTLTESLLALLIALACVSLIATFLVLEIEYIVNEQGISDMFMGTFSRLAFHPHKPTSTNAQTLTGLILVPLVEKVAEHLTAIDEAWDNSANMALSHCLGASVQTALLNSSIAVIVGWGLASYDTTGLHAIGMDLDFRSFEAIVLILAILVTGNFLRDGMSRVILFFPFLALCLSIPSHFRVSRHGCIVSYQILAS